MAFNLKKMFGKEESSEDFVELDLNKAEKRKEKIRVRPFVLRKYDDVNEILDAVREGFSIAIVDIKPLKTKDVIELKRSIAKLKKTVDAMEGTIAGFGENTLIVTPEFAEVYKEPMKAEKKETASFY